MTTESPEVENDTLGTDPLEGYDDDDEDKDDVEVKVEEPEEDIIVIHKCLICGIKYERQKPVLQFQSGYVLKPSEPILDEFKLSFMLKECLGLKMGPVEDFFSDLIDSFGEPGLWGVSFCSNHAQDIETAQDLRQQISQIRTKLDKCKTDIKQELRKSLEISEEGSSNVDDAYSRLRRCSKTILLTHGHGSSEKDQAKRSKRSSKKRAKASKKTDEAKSNNNGDEEGLAEGINDTSVSEDIKTEIKPETHDSTKSSAQVSDDFDDVSEDRPCWPLIDISETEVENEQLASPIRRTRRKRKKNGEVQSSVPVKKTKIKVKTIKSTKKAIIKAKSKKKSLIPKSCKVAKERKTVGPSIQPRGRGRAASKRSSTVTEAYPFECYSCGEEFDTRTLLSHHQSNCARFAFL